MISIVKNIKKNKEEYKNIKICNKKQIDSYNKGNSRFYSTISYGKFKKI